MKTRVLRTCCVRRARAGAARLMPWTSWRPVSLCWPSHRTPLTTTRVLQTRTTSTHLHYTSLHLHLSTAAPGTDDSRYVAPAARVFTAPAAPALTAAAGAHALHTRRHTQVFESVTRHEHGLHTVLRRERLETLHARQLRVTRESTVATPQTRDTALISRPATLTIAPHRPPAAHEAGAMAAARAIPGVAAASRPAAPSASWRHLAPAPIVWSKSGAGSPTGESAARDGGLLTTATPAASAAVDARARAASAATPTTQQVREALRVNLLDNATVERLTEDLLRRVEKRMRIERERRGL